MKRSSLLFAALGMVLLILDSRCAAQSTREALELCLRSVIPSLFPMFVLSGVLVSGFRSSTGGFGGGLERFAGLPRGGGGIFLLGLVGGFPVGAQCIAQAVETGSLSKSDSEGMLGFCNNCSPAFLFGIAGSVLSSRSAPLLIFLIQLESALLMASFTDFEGNSCSLESGPSESVSDAVARAVRSMATVCAWVVLAAVAVGFLDRWVYPLLPGMVPQICTGMLEITGGILGLTDIQSEEIRFLLCSGFVCFGGFSVWMQIASLASAQELSAARCFRQKTAQGLIGLFLAVGVLHLGPVSLLAAPAIVAIRKKTLEKTRTAMYNDSRKGGCYHVVP